MYRRCLLSLEKEAFVHGKTNQNILSILISYVQMRSKMIGNDQEQIQSDPTSCPQNQKGNN